MNKQYLSGFTILIAFLIIAPSIAVAVPETDYTISAGYQNVTPYVASEILDQKCVFILDVRTSAEYKHGHIEGAKLIPLKNVPAYDPVNLSDSQLLPNRMGELPKNKDMKVLVYCKAGNRGAAASQLIADAGYKRVYNVQGGINSWVNAGCPIVVDPTEWTASYPSSL
ncbi:rhodanese-like domain-containing protein [Methanosarcina horonobensis]|nr:rhodanese-like domain-containing protein [Methanosarcina horonobensis]